MADRKLAVSFATTKLSTVNAAANIEEEILVQPGVGERKGEGLRSERDRESKIITSADSRDTKRDESDRRNGNSLDENLQIMYSSSVESETDENVKNIRDWARGEKWKEIHDFLSSSSSITGETGDELTKEMKFKYASTKWIDDGIMGRDYRDIAYSNCNVFQAALNKSAPEAFLAYLLDIGGNKLVMEKNDIGQSCLHCVFGTYCGGNTVSEVLQSIDLILQMIDLGGKELLMMQDEDGRTALHILMRCPFVEGINKLSIMRHMYSVGGKEVFMTQDKKLGVPTALHLAFRLIGENGFNGNKTIEIIKFMMKVGGDDLILATDGNGLNILHYACMARVLTTEVIDIAARYNPTVDVRRRSNQVINEETCLKLITGRSNDGKLPIDYLLRSHDNFSMPPPEENRMARCHLQSIWASLDHYAMTVPPHLTNLVLEETRKLDEQGASADTFLDSTFTKAVLNQFSVTPFAIAILFIDLFMQSVLIIWYSFPYFEDEDITISGFSIPLIWFTFREISQLRSMSSFRNYTSDPSNWLDLIQLVLTLYVVVRRRMTSATSATIMILGILVSWIRMIFVFGNISYSIGVLVSAILKITSTLVPFLFVTIIIAMAFAHSFRRLGPLDGGMGCPVEVTNGAMYDRHDPKCLYELYFQTISMFLNSEWIYLDSYSGSHSVLSMVFALIVGILLLNIIIALISNVFTEIQKDSENAFWSRRLRFVIETDTMARTMKTLFLDKLKIENPRYLREIDRRYKMISWVERRIISNYDSRGYNYDSMERTYVQENMKWFFSSSEHIPPPPLFRRIILVLVVAEYKEIVPPSKGCIGFVMGKKQDELSNNRFPAFCECLVGIMILLLCLIVVFVGFFLGLFTFGYFWPKEVRHLFFCGKIVEVERNRSTQDIVSSEVENIKIEISRRIEISEKKQKEKISKVEEKIETLEDKVDNVLKLLKEIHEVVQSYQPSSQQE